MNVNHFHHRFVPGTAAGEGRTLLLLHGTGGNEDDLVPLGGMLAPGAALLSPRGRVLENGMPRFFRRLAEGVFDLADLRARTGELAEWIGVATREFGIDPAKLTAVGFSNGANIAASLLLSRPGTVGAAVLFRAMLPFEPEVFPSLDGTPVYLGQGRQDPLIPAESAERLAGLLRDCGAEITLRWQPGGHQLTRADVHDAAAWLKGAAVGG